ncbi:DUF1684 domain-containing protein [Aeromicrobium massiliense]|uniref:DUF1684 domain-containing protein n=1 Tax=Aeromicrobium massiliense TaxID=1464554 RepID=UPI0002EFD694|nr:DUF1684 domain-containing protein [Aeromicrobium massiliense]
MTQDDWLDGWQRWHDEREQAVLAPHGTASLTGTHWIGPDPVQVPGLDGSWKSEDGVVTDGDLRLAPGDEARVGDLLLTAIERDGELALRVWDPEAPTRTGLAGIDTFAPDAAWSATGRLEPAAETLSVDHVDGHTGAETFGGVVRVTVAGHELGLVTLVQPDGRLLVPFADTTNGTTTRQFRFLKLQPDADGSVEVDLNRAYLPPCAFTDHYLCPMPPRENRLTFAVEAGETHPRLR